ncbi:MAG TPA: LysR family transcriptional regulator [Pseudomonas sp.]|jgi:DNA-binding transcriptional LysR family regulator|nr:LysR family transcriptional regulator [Pseudomonas sp.]HCP02078.1 LysR family transcriptional regulator [Pseudomonas sp.]
MELRHLRYFIAVAEERHIGRAATRLHISQPPLTRQIQQLEEELDVQLFTRTPRGMDLTPAGELLLEEARNIRSIVEQAAERTQRAGQGKLGRLDIGIFGSAILDTIPAMLLKFRNAFPEVKVMLHNMTKDAQIAALRQRRIDIGFNRFIEASDDIVNEIVLTERILIALNEHHPLARQPEVPFSVLQDSPLIVFPTGPRPSFIDKVMHMCHQKGFTPQIAQEVGNTLTGVALVASDFGVCAVPESATMLALPGVVYRPILDPPEDSGVDLNCIYRVDDQSPLLRSFLDTVRTFRNRP